MAPAWPSPQGGACLPQLLLPPTQPLSSTPALPTPHPPRVLAPSIFLQGRGATLSSPLTPPWGEATVGGWVCHFRLCGLHSACGPAGWPSTPTLGRCNTGILLELSYHSSHATEGQTSLSCSLATGERRPLSPQTWRSPTVTGSWVLVQEKPV